MADRASPTLLGAQDRERAQRTAEQPLQQGSANIAKLPELLRS
jgi:hypothetical protein